MSSDRKAQVGKPCPYCNLTMGGFFRYPTRDHVVPKSRGGADSESNIIIVCARCNNDKANMLIGEWLGYLRALGDVRAPIIGELVAAAVGICPELREQIEVDTAVGELRTRPMVH